MAYDYDGLDNFNFMSNKLPDASQKRKRSNNSIARFSNFFSSPCLNLTWGTRKKLRCIKQSRNDNHDLPSSSSSFSRSTGNDDNGGTIEAVTDKLILDLRAKVQHINADSLQKLEQGEILKNPGALETRARNLRTIRAVCKEPTSVNGGGERKPGSVPTKAKLKEIKGINSDGDGCEVEGRRAKFSVFLSEKEIAEDFLALTGKAPPKRPKKRPRKVQNYVVEFCPGLYLTEIKASRYKVKKQ